MKPEEELINRYLNGSSSEEEVAELDKLLQQDAEIRKEFYQQSNVHAALQEEFRNQIPSNVTVVPRKHFLNRSVLALAATLVFGLGALFYLLSSPKPVATLVSNENAAWESALPTVQGSELKPGIMTLKSGVATLRFKSGAEVTLEAPSRIELETAMKGKLYEGNAILNVPAPAQGFILETPNGYAVDHGTSFSVSIGKESGEVAFEVLEGEISLHAHDGESLHLQEAEAASFISGKIVKADGPVLEGTLAPLPEVTRIETLGKTASAIHSNKTEYLHPDFLMVKETTNEWSAYNRRSILGFSTEGIDLDQATGAKLRLNLVPCGLGFAARLPKVNRFVVYGFVQDSEIDWNQSLKWKQLPDLKTAKPLGTFEIPRSQERGTFTLETPELLDFVKTHPNSEVTFLIKRETGELKGSGLVHAFASDSHPEASGPTLELSYATNLELTAN